MTGIVTKENFSPVNVIKVLISMPTFIRDSEDFLISQPKNEVSSKRAGKVVANYIVV